MLFKLKEVTSSFFAVVFDLAARRFVDYCGILYRSQKEADLTIFFRFHFIVVKNLNVCIKVGSAYRAIVHC